MFRSIRQALGALVKLRTILLVFIPPILSLLGFFILFLVYWQKWVLELSSFFSTLSLLQWLQNSIGYFALAEWFATIFLIFLFVPLAYLGSILLTILFVMPFILKLVVGADFKHLQKKRGGSFIGSLGNTIWVTLVFAVAFMVTLPLWFLPGLQIAVPLLLTAWLNKKVFLYDVLQDYASAEERRYIESEESLPLLGMGLILGFLNYIPFVIFIAPVLTALSYTYFGLNALEEYRKAKHEFREFV